MIGKAFSQSSSVAHEIDAAYIDQMLHHRDAQIFTLRDVDGLPSFEISTT